MKKKLIISRYLHVHRSDDRCPLPPSPFRWNQQVRGSPSQEKCETSLLLYIRDIQAWIITPFVTFLLSVSCFSCQWNANPQKNLQYFSLYALFYVFLRPCIRTFFLSQRYYRGTSLWQGAAKRTQTSGNKATVTSWQDSPFGWKKPCLLVNSSTCQLTKNNKLKNS